MTRQSTIQPPPGRSRPGHTGTERHHPNSTNIQRTIQEQRSLDRPPSAAFRSHKPRGPREPEQRKTKKTRTCRDRQEFGPPSSSRRLPRPRPIPTCLILHQPFLSLDSKNKRPPHQVAVGESTPVLPHFLTTPYPPTPQPSDHSDATTVLSIASSAQ